MEEIEDEAVEITANTVDGKADEAEWEKIKRHHESSPRKSSHVDSASSSNPEKEISEAKL